MIAFKRSARKFYFLRGMKVVLPINLQSFFAIAVSNKSVLKSGRLQASSLYHAASSANFEGILVYF